MADSDKIIMMFGKDATYRVIDGIYEVKTLNGNKLLYNDLAIDIGNYVVSRKLNDIVTLSTESNESEIALASLLENNIIKVHYGAFEILENYIVVADSENRVSVTDKKLNVLADIEFENIIKCITDVVEIDDKIEFNVVRYAKSFGSSVAKDKCVYSDGVIQILR